MNLKLLVLAFTRRMFPQTSYFIFVFSFLLRKWSKYRFLYALFFFFFCHKGDFGPASPPKPSHSKPVGAVWPLLLQGAVHLNGVLGVLMDPESLQVDKTLGINLQ